MNMIQSSKYIPYCHQIETFSAILALCGGNPQVNRGLPSERPVSWSFDAFFDLSLNKRLSNNRNAGDLRRHRAHYDVIVMTNGKLTNEDLEIFTPGPLLVTWINFNHGMDK